MRQLRLRESLSHHVMEVRSEKWDHQRCFSYLGMEVRSEKWDHFIMGWEWEVRREKWDHQRFSYIMEWEWEVRSEITRGFLTSWDGSEKWEVRSPEVFLQHGMEVRSEITRDFLTFMGWWEWEVRSEITRDFLTFMGWRSEKVSGDLTSHFSLPVHGMGVRSEKWDHQRLSHFHGLEERESLWWSHSSLLTPIPWCKDTSGDLTSDFSLPSLESEKVSGDLTSHFSLPSHDVRNISGDLTSHFSLPSHDVRTPLVISLLTPMPWCEKYLCWSHFSLLTPRGRGYDLWLVSSSIVDILGGSGWFSFSLLVYASLYQSVSIRLY